MAFLGEYNVNDLPEGNVHEPLPAGWYQVKVSSAELKNNKAGTGQYIAIKYDVLGPTHQGRKVFGNINITNQSPKAEEIGRQNLGDLMRAIGLTRVTDTDQLIGGTLSIKLAIQDDEKYGASNDVKGYKALEGAVPPIHAAVTSDAPKAAKAPWAK